MAEKKGYGKLFVGAIVTGFAAFLWSQAGEWTKFDRASKTELMTARRTEALALIADVQARLDAIVDSYSDGLERSANITTLAFKPHLSPSSSEWAAQMDKEFVKISPVWEAGNHWLRQVEHDERRVCELLGEKPVLPLALAHSSVGIANALAFLARSNVITGNQGSAEKKAEALLALAQRLRSLPVYFRVATKEALADPSVIEAKAFAGCDRDWLAVGNAQAEPTPIR